MLSKKEQKLIKSLKIKKYRTREKRFLVEGTKNVLELLNSDFTTELIVATNIFLENNDNSLGKHRIETVKPDLLTQLSTFKTNEDVLAIAQMKQDVGIDKELDDHLFVLDGVGDPGNLGTIIRTLDWFGFKQLVCSMECAEFYHPKTIASSMGSFTRMQVIYEPLDKLLSKVNIPILAADMHGQNLAQMKIDQPSIIIMGSESHGISASLKPHITDYVTIPKFGQAESLNVGIATGIIAGHLRMSR